MRVDLLIRSAQQEVSQMYDVVSMLEAGRHLHVFPSVRPPVPSKTELDNLLYEAISKQQVTCFPHITAAHLTRSD